MIKKIGFQSVLTDNYDLISKSKTLIFPGVGNFDNVMSKIYEKKIDKAIYNSLENNSKLLGICLGMQALFSRSEEGKLEGLNLIKGQILKFNFNDKKFKIPHMGWNNVKIEKKHELFSGIEDKQFFYFVHSFVALNTETSITTTHYGEEFVSSLATENIFATQFHPEKSGEIGLKFLENFINWKI